MKFVCDYWIQAVCHFHSSLSLILRPWRWRQHVLPKRGLAFNGTKRIYIPGDRTILTQFLWASLGRCQCLVCRASICRMDDVLEGSSLDLFQVKSRRHFRGGNCARERSQRSATDCSSLLDLSLSLRSPWRMISSGMWWVSQATNMKQVAVLPAACLV
jgi:hypothetical protein